MREEAPPECADSSGRSCRTGAGDEGDPGKEAGQKKPGGTRRRAPITMNYSRSFMGFMKRKYTMVQFPRIMKIVATMLEIASVETPVRP